MASGSQLRIAVVLIAKNEAPYLLEWMAHYKSLDFDRIIVYNNGSNDGTSEILARLDSQPFISVKNWSPIEGISPQLSAYNNALSALRNEVEYVAFFDADEFLIPCGAMNLKQILADLQGNHPDFGALAINQVVFGSNGHESFQPEPVLKRFPRRGPDSDPESKWVKSIYKLSCVKEITDVHRTPLIPNFEYYNSSGEALSFGEKYPGIVDCVDKSKVQLNHYITKSKQEYLTKKARGGSFASTITAKLSRYANPMFFTGRLGLSSVLDQPTIQFADRIAEAISSLERALPRDGDIPKIPESERSNTPSTPSTPSAPNNIPDMPHVPVAVMRLMKDVLSTSKTFLEYGSGGSTMLAARLGVRTIVSVESDGGWLERVTQKLSSNDFSGSDHIAVHVDIGKTTEWGFPANENRWRNYPKYALQVWPFCREKGIAPDLVLIDGRFRVACWFAAFLFAEPGCRVLFDDYANREYYHSVEKYILPNRVIDRMAEFVVPEKLPRDDFWLAFVSSASDTR